ncbi:MAG: sensor histidine kinase [Thermoleophilia bacterium]
MTTEKIEFKVKGFHQIWLKLLITYVSIAAVCLGVVIVIIHEISSRNYNSHVQHMSQNGMEQMMSGTTAGDLNQAFSDAINYSLLWGGIIAVILAIILSLFIARRITRPIHDMAAATEKIAEGDYSHRVDIASRDEIGSLAHSLNAMAVHLEESQRLRRELMANIAHELRTPLTSISGFMEGLEDGVVPANTETYSLVRREALRMSRLVEDLQRLSRAESGQEAMDLIEIELGTFLERVIRKMKPQFSDKGVNLVFHAGEAVPPFLADEDKLDQIVINLVDNALRYTEPGGSVSLSSSVRKGMVAIEVVDTGAGIDPLDLPHVFERFYRADKSRARVSGGSGIGLTLVKRYTESLGGHVEVKSVIEQGTSFTLFFPVISPMAGKTLTHKKKEGLF